MSRDTENRRKYGSEYNKRQYHENPEYRAKHMAMVAINRARYFEQSKLIVAEFRSQGCLICGELDHACLSAHHLDPSAKEIHVHKAYHQPKKLEKELSGCVCVCENCHRKYHAGRFSFLK